MGAHPGGLFTRDTPAAPYGEDLEFWSDVSRISRTDEFDAWIGHWVLEPADQQDYLQRLGSERIDALVARADPGSWRADEAAYPPDLDAPVGAWEQAAVFGARYLAERIVARGADAVLAGAGVANLASWLAVHLARDRGAEVELTAELGLWGYEPTPADPFVFNHRSFPTATMLSDSEQILGMMAGSPGTTLLACLGAAQIDRSGNINSTVIPGRAFLVGSGGGNDVASRADEVVVMATLTSRRTVEEVPYVTSPGGRVGAFVSDLGIFEKGDAGTFVLTAVAPGPEPVEERVAKIGSLCGWHLDVAPHLVELAPAEEAHVQALRRGDPRGHFLRPDA
jgi:acyl CoA:acetate/3-ketoacid CoA transferase beta subunit